MSSSGSSTRDWLLDKLLKLRIAMTELKADYELKLAAALEVRDRAVQEAHRHREDWMELHARVAQMAPGKQFSVVYRGGSGARLPLAILSVNSANGHTTITVERAD